MSSKDILKQYSESNRYFKPPVGQEVILKFLKADTVKNYFDQGKSEVIRYYLEVNGVIQYWDRASKSLASQMSEIPEGSTISILRTGYKNETKYKIKKIE